MRKATRTKKKASAVCTMLFLGSCKRVVPILFSLNFILIVSCEIGLLTSLLVSPARFCKNDFV